MQVLTVTPLDKRRSKVLVDEGFAFVLYKGELSRYHIEEGCRLPEEVYKAILEDILKKRARERALYLLKVSDRTEAEVRRKLREGCYPEEAIDSTLEFLKEYRFVDDLDYGRRYIHTYGNSRSRRRIQFDLMQKGLEKELVAMLLEEEEVSEEAQIEAFLRKKGYFSQSAALGADDGEGMEEGAEQGLSQKECSKLVMALGRKGFSYDAIYRVMGAGNSWE